MKAMVFAAGLGTRLKPFTDSHPKALFPVCGKPLLEHLLLKLYNSGIDEAVVNVHHFPGQIRSFLSSNDLPLKTTVSDESGLLLETGGGLLHARALLEGSGDILLHNVDIVSDLDIRKFVAAIRQEATATLVVSERDTARQLLFDPDTLRLKGWTNRATGEVRSPFEGLDPRACRALAFSGIHLVSDRIFDAFGAFGFSGRFPIMDFYLKACASIPVYGFVPEGGLRLTDVGKSETLPETERVCKELLG